MYNTLGLPSRHIPLEKSSRAKAMIQYVLQPHITLSRLGLSIVVGVLESLVDDTPNKIGSGLMMDLYVDLHPPTDGDTSSRDSYNKSVVLSKASRKALAEWDQLLPARLGYRIQPRDISALCALWGDGSGDGTGGTKEILSLTSPGGTGITPFMGVWSPEVHSFSSNWKELKTILVSLQRSAQDDPSSVRNRLIIYFTDNMVSYDIIRKRRSKIAKLHQLVCEISSLEVSLDCSLICIHVPGTTMILQGTDGLSRGLALSRFNLPPADLYSRLFAPLPPIDNILQWALSKVNTAFQDLRDWVVATDLSSWDDLLGSSKRIIWTVSPQICRQAMTTAALDWSSHPLDHEHIFITPRLCQRSFGRVNRHIEFVGQFLDVPDFCPLTHVLIFYLPSFVRSLDPESGVDSPPPGPRPKWVAQQAIKLHGLS